MIGPQTILTLQSRENVKDLMGGIIAQYTSIKNISGVLTRPTSSNVREIQLNNKQTVIADYVFFIDHDSTVTEKHKLTDGTRTFDILFVYNPGNYNHHLELHLIEIK